MSVTKRSIEEQNQSVQTNSGTEPKAKWDPKSYWTPERKAEHAAKMRVALSSPEVRAKLSRTVGEAEREQIRESLKGYYETHSGPMTGKTHTEKTKLALKAKMLRKYGKEEEAVKVEAQMAELGYI